MPKRTVSYTQENRRIGIATPLDKDELLLSRLRGEEGISKLFRFELELLSENPSIDFDALVGKNVTFWITLAGILAAANVAFIVVGFVKFGDTGYAGKTKWLGIHNELWIGVGILIIGVLLFVYRRVVQDKGRIHWRDPEVPDVPAPSAGIHAPAPAG